MFRLVVAGNMTDREPSHRDVSPEMAERDHVRYPTAGARMSELSISMSVNDWFVCELGVYCPG